MDLHDLSPRKGSTKKRKRVGRGPGSGLGKTSGKGHKGQKARSGGGAAPGFEGGQMPLHRRLPKRGFRPYNRKDIVAVNLKELERHPKLTNITPETLRASKIIGRDGDGVKLLGDGEVTQKLTVRVHAVSAGARKKIEEAGGTIEIIPMPIRGPKIGKTAPKRDGAEETAPVEATVSVPEQPEAKQAAAKEAENPVADDTSADTPESTEE